MQQDFTSEASPLSGRGQHTGDRLTEHTSAASALSNNPQINQVAPVGADK